MEALAVIVVALAAWLAVALYEADEEVDRAN